MVTAQVPVGVWYVVPTIRRRMSWKNREFSGRFLSGTSVDPSHVLPYETDLVRREEGAGRESDLRKIGCPRWRDEGVSTEKYTSRSTSLDLFVDVPV